MAWVQDWGCVSGQHRLSLMHTGKNRLTQRMGTDTDTHTHTQKTKPKRQEHGGSLSLCTPFARTPAQPWRPLPSQRGALAGVAGTTPHTECAARDALLFPALSPQTGLLPPLSVWGCRPPRTAPPTQPRKISALTRARQHKTKRQQAHAHTKAKAKTKIRSCEKNGGGGR